MNKLVTIRKVPPKPVRITKVAPRRVSIQLARPTVTIETAWNEVEW